MFASIRWRLVTSYMLLALLVVSVVGLLALLGVQRYARQQERASLTANAEAVARQAAPLLWPAPSSLELRQLSRTAAFFGNVRVRIFDQQNRVVADSGSPSDGNQSVLFVISGLPNFPTENWILGLTPLATDREPGKLYNLLEGLPADVEITAIQRHTGPWGSRFSFKEIKTAEELRALEEQAAAEESKRSGQTVSVTVSDGRRRLGRVELSAGTDFGAEALATTRRGLLVAGAGAVVLAGVVGLLMGNRLSAPLAELTNTATKMSAGDLSVRARVDSRDEIGRLASQFNQMAEQLQASFSQLEAERDALRRFIADASHELRTPITALRSFNDLLQGAAAQDPVAREEFLRESQVQIERLAWITQNLLDLSRLDAGLAGLELEPHDLREVVESGVAAFRGAAQEKDIRLETILPQEPIQAEYDQARLEMALSNLLENALKFTPRSGRVVVGIKGDQQDWTLYVEDSGEGIPAKDYPRIFERFYRGENSHGSGLGLSIVQSILSAHGWSVRAENLPSGGARFSIHPTPQAGQGESTSS